MTDELLLATNPLSQHEVYGVKGRVPKSINHPIIMDDIKTNIFIFILTNKTPY